MMRVALLACLLTATPVYGRILSVDVESVIDPITADFLRSAVAQAEEENAEFLLIRLSTPGGLGISMQEIVEVFLNSKVPIVCYVGPSGNRAASAGFFILLAADVAAMMPGTNTGAATPVFPIGEGNETMLRKVQNDALANLRSIVEKRDRNYELAKKAVEEAASFTETEALEGKLIDLVVDSEADLLAKLDGFEVARFNGNVQKLATRDVPVAVIEMTFRQKVLSMLANPNLALILGMMGLVGLYLEFTNPGLIFPGVAGAISLLLALLGFSLIPINAIGVLLILLSLGLFIAEIKVQGFGILGIGGIVALLLGLLILVDSPFPEVRIDLGLAFGAALAFGLIFLFLTRLAVRAFLEPKSPGSDTMVGLIGTARSDIDSEQGKVLVNGEWWDAVSESPIDSGAKVRIVKSDRMTLTVEPGHSD